MCGSARSRLACQTWQTGPVDVRELDTSDWAAGDQILREVYVGEKYVEATSGEHLTISSKADGGRWLGAFTPDRALFGIVLLTEFGTDAAVVAEPGGAEIRLLAVTKKGRRSGIGRALLIEAEKIAASTGCKVMTFSTQSTMGAAHRLYVSLGYERVAAMDYVLGERQFIVFRKPLALA